MHRPWDAQDKDLEALHSLGGVPGIVKALGSDLHTGIDPTSVRVRQAAFGANRFREVPAKNFFYLMYENLQVRAARARRGGRTGRPGTGDGEGESPRRNSSLSLSPPKGLGGVPTWARLRWPG